MGRRIFDEAEKQFIRDNYNVMSINKIAQQLNATWAQIKRELTEMGINSYKGMYWSEEEIKKLEKMAQHSSMKAICKALGRSYQSVYDKARRLGIVVRLEQGRVWKEEEVKQIVEAWGEVQVETIARNLRRSPGAVKRKAREVGLPPLTEAWKDLLVTQAGRALGISPRCIYDTWQKKGLPIKYRKLSRNLKWRYVELKDLLKFMKEHPNLYDAGKIEPNALGHEPAWLQEKRLKDIASKDHLEMHVKRKKWTKEEKDLLALFIKSGASYDDICRRLNKSRTSVTRMVTGLGLGFRYKKYWQPHEIQYLKDNYMDMTYKELAEKLNKTETSIALKCNRYGLQKRRDKRNEQIKVCGEEVLHEQSGTFTDMLS